jgi:hypothetical protein
VRIASLSKWSLNMATDKVDVTAFGDTNKTYVQGLRDIKGQLSGFWDNADDSLFDGSDSTDGVNLYLYPSSSYTSTYFYGPAWLDASIDVSVSGAVTVSGDFVANGAWSRKP